VVGGGLVLAAACDLRVAADDVNFFIPEVDLGIPLAWGGIPRLVREIGPALTKELVMTCRPFDAAEAKAAGFVNRVVPAANLDSAVEDLAEEVASRSRLAVLATKAHVNAVTSQMVGTGRAWSDGDGFGAALRDPEARAAQADYLEKMQSARRSQRTGNGP
jgi:enoyl-CoA hydratase/carnithine racemase